MKHFISLAVLNFLVLTEVRSQITLDSTTITVTTIAQNLDTPWEILWGPDDKIWFTERGGTVGRVDPADGLVEILLEIDEVVEEEESGLLGMALHPNFDHPDSQFVYLVYTYDTPVGTERLVRYTFDKDRLTNPVVLLDGIPANTNHDGSRIIITSDHKIMMTTGDTYDTSLPQNTASLGGKTLRLNLDGTIPDDNPINDSPVWSIGHRNAQGLVEADNGLFYSSEHGPASDDELNIINRNANYGWPTVKGYCDTSSEQAFCSANDVKEPIIAWTPTLAVAGIDFYNHEAIPEWSNAVLLTTLKERDFRVLRLNVPGSAIMDEKIYFDNEYGRLRDVCVSPDGDIYFSTSNRDGRANGGFPIVSDDRIIRLSNDEYKVITGTQELIESPLHLYPNPVDKYLYIKTTHHGSIAIHDLKARLLYQGSLKSEFDVSWLQAGTYILSVIAEEDTERLKFVKR